MKEEFIVKPQEVHIWRIALADFKASEVRHFLSSDETERANRFHFDKDKEQFTVARASLRQILGLYTDIPPSEIEFQYGQRGKPTLKFNPISLNFNISHSNWVAVVAVCQQNEIGVDIEKINLNYNPSIAQRFFSKDEYKALITLPLNEQPSAFYQLWTCKEAVIKALGEGLYIPLSDFSIELEHEKQWVNLIYNSRQIKLYIEFLSVFPQYKASFATCMGVHSQVYWEWTPTGLKKLISF